MKKSGWHPVLRPAMGAARQILPWRWQTLGLTAHFLQLSQITALGKARYSCLGAMMCTVPR